MTSTKSNNSNESRLIRIESRLTQLGRWMGTDLRRRPPPNQPDSPVYIDEAGTVYVTSQCTVGALSVAVRRYSWPEDTDEAPVVLNGIEIGVINPNIGVLRDESACD